MDVELARDDEHRAVVAVLCAVVRRGEEREESAVGKELELVLHVLVRAKDELQPLVRAEGAGAIAPERPRPRAFGWIPSCSFLSVGSDQSMSERSPERSREWAVGCALCRLTRAGRGSVRNCASER